jgi:hemerythrin-like domain-containing protein
VGIGFPAILARDAIDLPNHRLMKRHPALLALSRDHHHALVVAQRLRQATADTKQQAIEAFLAFWDPEGQQHFRLEEDFLLPAYAAHSDPRHPAVIEVLLDHVMIRCDAARLAEVTDLETLQVLGKRLADHVSLEEHELFPRIEDALSETELNALGSRLRLAK